MADMPRRCCLIQRSRVRAISSGADDIGTVRYQCAERFNSKDSECWEGRRPYALPILINLVFKFEMQYSENHDGWHDQECHP